MQMAKKEKEAKKPQLRRCAICQKVGHNKSTCPEKFQQPAAKKANQPLNFFVHHVNYEPPQSPHVVNLKNRNDIWDKVQSSAPEEPKNKDFYFYHHSAANDSFSEDAKPETKFDFGPSFAPSNNIKTKNKKQRSVNIVKSASKSAEKIGGAFVSAKQKIYNNSGKILKTYFTPRRVVAAALILTIVFLAPSRAQTYYTDVKSTANDVAGNSTAGFKDLQNSTSALMKGDIGGAQDTLANALQNFNQAVDTLESKHRLLQSLVSIIPVVNSEIQSRQNLILAGQDMSLGNSFLLKGLSEIQSQPSSTITANMKILGEYLDYSIPNYKKAITELNNVDDSAVPAEYQQTFKDFRVLFSAFYNDLENISNLNQSIQEIFGGKGLRRYLVIFQNPYEIRPTGGFMGSFALIDIEDGNIVKIDIPAGGSYDLQGQLTENVEPPAPLLLSNKRWEFQDANWFPDFPASAEKMLWFYRHSRKITADGVIAVNASVLSRLLDITGPVTEESRNLTITKDNALATIQDIVENGPEKQDNKPKQILADLASVFIQNFKNLQPQSILPILLNLQDALEKKEIQSYFTDSDAENAMKQFGWSGQILSTDASQDYLFVVNTNIQGQKSDAKINQTISHQAAVDSDGNITDTVTVTRTHTGQAGEDMYGVPNIDYIRVYAPQGSKLIAASGFTWPDEQKFKTPASWENKDEMLAEIEKEISTDPQTGTRITEEFGKTAFANWVITEPGQTTQAQFIYQLPFKAFSSDDSSVNKWAEMFQSGSPISKYQLIVQKQSGVDSLFESQIIYPDKWHPVWQNGSGASLASNGAAISKSMLGKDSIWSLVMSLEKD